VRQSSETVRHTYYVLTAGNTLAASLIWGINTLFLLDAGLTNSEAFGANAFFTAGLAIFEVPTGVVADTRGRRASYLLGTVCLMFSTLLYLVLWRTRASFSAWAAVSVLLGLGFSFFSGAFEAWLVDAMTASGYEGKLDPVFAKGQIVEGIAMLAGSVGGGAVAQATNLGVPYLLRAILLGITLVVALIFMRDLGFQPTPSRSPLQEMKAILGRSLHYGLQKGPVRWIMLSGPFMTGVSIYAFYAMQPYLLQLYGDAHAYWVAGLAAAIVAGAQIAGGLLVPTFVGKFRRRTSALLIGMVVSTGAVGMLAFYPSFWPALALLVVWGLMFSALTPVRQAYLNALLPSKERATLLSFDSLLGSGGAAVIQPALGRVADVWSYPTSYAASAVVQVLAVPFVWMARRAGDD